MILNCLKSGLRGLNRVFSLAAILAGVFATGCSTAPTPGTEAPRSSVSRDHAVSLAQIAASNVGGQVFTVAASGSMKPTLDENSIVTIETVPFAELRKGDIIIYRNRQGVPIIHRLYEETNGRWLVLGDNNAALDREAVTADNIVGRVCAIFYAAPGSQDAAHTAIAKR